MKGTSLPDALEQLQGRGSAEAGQIEVSQHHIPFGIGLVECAAHVIGSLDAVHQGA